jgi:hypothetical protein
MIRTGRGGSLRTVLLSRLKRMTKSAHLSFGERKVVANRELGQPIHLPHLLLLQRCRIYSWLAASAAEMGAVMASFLSLGVEGSGKLF